MDPRSRNPRGSFFSRSTDSDDWSIASHVFERLNTKWGPHSFDLYVATIHHAIVFTLNTGVQEHWALKHLPSNRRIKTIGFYHRHGLLFNVFKRYFLISALLL